MFTSLRNSPLVSLYQKKREVLYIPFSILIEGLVTNLLGDRKIEVHQVTSRVKTVSSFAEKIRRKRYKYRFLSEVTDIVGVRVITYLASDVDRVYALLAENFSVDSQNSVDKRVAASASQFGYQSLHLVAQLNKDRVALPEYAGFRTLKFEVQVRSILQHSWAEIEHDISYKSVVELPPSIKRKLHRAAALLEQADELFNEIGCDLVQKNLLDAKLGSHGAHERITPKLFGMLLEKDELVIQLEELLDSLSEMGIARKMDPADILKMRIADMNAVGIHTIRDLRVAIVENLHHIADFSALRLRGDEESDHGGTYYRSACVCNLCEFIIGKTGDYDRVLKYLVRNSVRVDPYEEQMAREIVEAVREILRSQDHQV
ncbi:MAG TPA: hypothetical protein VI279_02690 [Rhodocyclaceae bacterium]